MTRSARPHDQSASEASSGRVLRDLGDRVRVQRFRQTDGTAPVLVWPKAGLRWSPDPRVAP